MAVVAAFVAATILVGCGGGGSDGDSASPTSKPTDTTATASADWEGTVHALTYNVAGLPEALSGSNPEVNTQQIAPKLNSFDLVLLQETWKTPDPNPLAPTRVYYEIIDGLTNHKYKSPMPEQPLGKSPKRSSALAEARSHPARSATSQPTSATSSISPRTAPT